MIRPILALSIVLAVSGLPARAQPAAATQAAAPAPGAYQLQAGDTIDIRFFYNEELNESAQIRPDGLISMPLVGDVRAAGHSAASMAADLAARYKDIVKQPNVTVQIRNFANRRIFVGGEVARPGVLPLTGVQTVLGAVSEAGGLTQRAKRGEVVLIRRLSEEHAEVRRVSLSAKNGEPPEAATLMLQPLDVVLVPESGIAKVNRAVDQYVRQMVPGLLTFGFSYLFNAGIVGVQE